MRKDNKPQTGDYRIYAETKFDGTVVYSLRRYYCDCMIWGWWPVTLDWVENEIVLTISTECPKLDVVLDAYAKVMRDKAAKAVRDFKSESCTRKVDL